MTTDTTTDKHWTSLVDRNSVDGISVDVTQWDFPEHDVPTFYDTGMHVHDGATVEARVGCFESAGPYVVVEIKRGGDTLRMFIDRPVADALRDALDAVD